MRSPVGGDGTSHHGRLSLKRSLEDLGAGWYGRISVRDALGAIGGHCHRHRHLNLAGEMSTPVLDRLMATDTYIVVGTGYDPSGLEERFRQLPRCESRSRAPSFAHS